MKNTFKKTSQNSSSIDSVVVPVSILTIGAVIFICFYKVDTNSRSSSSSSSSSSEDLIPIEVPKPSVVEPKKSGEVHSVNQTRKNSRFFNIPNVINTVGVVGAVAGVGKYAHSKLNTITSKPLNPTVDKWLQGYETAFNKVNLKSKPLNPTVDQALEAYVTGFNKVNRISRRPNRHVDQALEAYVTGFNKVNRISRRPNRHVNQALRTYEMKFNEANRIKSKRLRPFVDKWLEGYKTEFDMANLKSKPLNPTVDQALRTYEMKFNEANAPNQFSTTLKSRKPRKSNNKPTIQRNPSTLFAANNTIADEPKYSKPLYVRNVDVSTAQKLLYENQQKDKNLISQGLRGTDDNKYALVPYSNTEIITQNGAMSVACFAVTALSTTFILAGATAGAVPLLGALAMGSAGVGIGAAYEASKGFIDYNKKFSIENSVTTPSKLTRRRINIVGNSTRRNNLLGSFTASNIVTTDTIPELQQSYPTTGIVDYYEKQYGDSAYYYTSAAAWGSVAAFAYGLGATGFLMGATPIVSTLTGITIVGSAVISGINIVHATSSNDEETEILNRIENVHANEPQPRLTFAPATKPYITPQIFDSLAAAKGYDMTKGLNASQYNVMEEECKNYLKRHSQKT